MSGARIDRRSLLVGVGLAACTRPLAKSGPSSRAALGGGPVELYSVFDLPHDDGRSRELSGLAWEAREGLLWAVQDEDPGLVALKPAADFKSWSFARRVPVAQCGPVDLEGIVVLEDGFLLSSEDGPRIIEVTREGIFRRELPIPAFLRTARNNRSLESLTMSPNARYLFTTTEAALPGDGELATGVSGTRVRILRMDRVSGAVTQHAYETDPMPYAYGDWGVADMAALSEDELLVLERGWTIGRGNTARVYHVTLDRESACDSVDALSATSPMLAKRLRVDFAHLAAPPLPEPKQPQPSPLLDNYEGLTIGPHLKDGRSTLVLCSDDNGHATQVARLLVLACS